MHGQRNVARRQRKSLAWTWAIAGRDCWTAAAWAASALLLGGAGFGAAAAPAPAPAAIDPGHLAGTWLLVDYRPSQRYTARQRMQMTIDGKEPPLQPWARRLLDQRIKDADEGNGFANTVTNCLPGGVPAMMFGPEPMRIMPSREIVAILFEELNHYRMVYLNKPHEADPDSNYMGDSIAHWEGATLVVDTIGLTDKTTIDGVGMPHTPALHVVERMRRIDANTLEDVMTIDDPKTFTAQWTAKALYKAVPNMKINEYICDNNRNGSSSMNGVAGFAIPATTADRPNGADTPR